MAARLPLHTLVVFLGAGYVSGQELWQFFGAFGNWGYLGFLVAAVLFVLFGILLVRLTQMCGSAEMDRVLIPWDVPWMRRLTGAIAALFLLGVVVIMTAGVAALLQQLFQVPVWLGAAAFTLIVALAAMAGVTGMVRAFSALVPVLVGVALAATLHPLLGVGYGVLLLLSMFCNELASLVALATYLEQKHPALQTRRKLLPAVMAPLIWGGSLVGFGDLIGVVFPVFGYVSIILLILMVVHLIRCKRAVHSVKTEPAAAGDAVNE